MNDLRTAIPNGSNILVRRKGFLPAGIRHFMDDPFNHTEKAVVKNGQLFTFGAVGKGCLYRPMHDALRNEKWTKIQVFAPTFHFDHGFLRNICDYHEGTPYQKVNFIQWLIYLRYGFWIGKDNAKKIYCYELTARICETLVQGTFPKGHVLERTHIKTFRGLLGYAFSGEYSVFQGELYQTNRTI